MKSLVALGLVIAGLAWAGEESSPPPSEAASKPTNVAEVNGRIITMQALDEKMQTAQVRTMEEMALYRLQHSGLQKLISDTVLQQEAERRGLSTEQLVAEVSGPGQTPEPVSAETAEAYYEENPDLFPEGKEAALKKIPDLIRAEQAEYKLRRFLGQLEVKARPVVYLLPPASPEGEMEREGLKKSFGHRQYFPPAEAPSGVLATVNGHSITPAELEALIQKPVPQRELLHQAIKRTTLDHMIGELLVEEEAKRRGASRDELYESITHASTLEVSEAGVENVYQRLKKSEPQEDEQKLKDKARQQLRRRKATPVWRAFVEGLKVKATIVQHLDPAPQAVPPPS